MELESFIRQIPPFTKFFMCSIFAITLVASFGIVDPYYIVMDHSKFLFSFQFWRFFTWFAFAGKFSFSFLMIMMLTHFSVGTLERYFGKHIPDFYYMVLFVMICNHLIGFLLNSYMVLWQEFLYALLYIACKREPDSIVNFWGFAIKMSNFPWVLIIFSILIGQDILRLLSGYAAGHLYEFLKFILKDTYGYRILDTPAWFQRFCFWTHWKINEYSGQPQPRAQLNNMRNPNNDPAQEFHNANFRAFRGGGVRLGGN